MSDYREPMDPVRMQHGDCEGDVVGSYSADRISEDKPIRSPFPWRGGLWVCTSIWDNDVHAYRLMPLGAFAGKPTTYSLKVCSDGEHSAEAARNDPNGFYHGITVKHAGSALVLTGPEMTFFSGDVGQATFEFRDDPRDHEPDHEPDCTCTRIDVDLYDARGCELCDPQSEYNRAYRARERAEQHPVILPVHAASGPDRFITDDDCPF